MARWEEALDAKVDCLNYWRSPAGRRYAAGWVESVQRSENLNSFVGLREDATEYERWRATQSLSNYSSLLDESGEGDPVIGLLRIEISKMMRAEPIWVSPQMFDLAEIASEEFVPEPLLPSDLPTDCGFMLFPRPMVMEDVHLKRSSFRAVSWMPCVIEGKNGRPSKHGISLSLYTHKEDFLNPEIDDYARDFLNSPMENIVGQWGMLHQTNWMFDNEVPKYFRREQGWWRQLQCLLRLSMQYISTRDKHYASRQARKRAKRADLDDDGYVTVIELRRPRSQSNNEGGTVDWSHRWIVGGHWRNQWYPSLQAHRQIYIAPYVKGPEDKELQIRTMRAFEIVK